MSRRWERFEPLAGIVAVALWVAGVIVLEGPADQPDTDAPALEILSFFKDEGDAILTGAFLFMLGSLFFLWFVGSLRASLRGVEDGYARLTATAFGGGLATGISLLLLQSPKVVGAVNDKRLTPGAAQVYLGLGDAFFFAAELAAAVMLVATALLALRPGILPRWLAWVSLLLALVLLFPPIGWAGLVVGVPLWTILVSLLLYAKAGRLDAPPPFPDNFIRTG